MLCRFLCNSYICDQNLAFFKIALFQCIHKTVKILVTMSHFIWLKMDTFMYYLNLNSAWLQPNSLDYALQFASLSNTFLLCCSVLTVLCVWVTSQGSSSASPSELFIGKQETHNWDWLGLFKWIAMTMSCWSFMPSLNYFTCSRWNWQNKICMIVFPSSAQMMTRTRRKN